jgi:hypothetical protein
LAIGFSTSVLAARRLTLVISQSAALPLAGRNGSYLDQEICILKTRRNAGPYGSHQSKAVMRG